MPCTDKFQLYKIGAKSATLPTTVDVLVMESNCPWKTREPPFPSSWNEHRNAFPLHHAKESQRSPEDIHQQAHDSDGRIVGAGHVQAAV